MKPIAATYVNGRTHKEQWMNLVSIKITSYIRFITYLVHHILYKSRVLQYMI